jgi:hypothetical protein
MGGDVWQWNEWIINNTVNPDYRGSRGGSYVFGSDYLASSARFGDGATWEQEDSGFRVASVPTGWVPEPSTIALLLASAACLLGYAWRRRAS